MNKKVIEKRKKILLDIMGDPIYRPMRLRELAMLLNVPRPERKALYEILDALIEEGKASLDNKGRYRKGKTLEGKVLEGTFVGNSRGFGFVEIPDEEEDIFIPEEATGTAMHMDKVQVCLKEEGKEGRRREGQIVKVLERGITEVVGTFDKSQNYGFVISDNPRFSKDIFIPKEFSHGASHGDKVIAVITDYGSSNKNPEGKITEVLGNINTPGTDILAIAKGFGLPTEFPPRVRNQAGKMKDHVIESDFQGRMDLRKWTIVTIDGEDAKDLDDGISLTKEGKTYHLGVHIADVSNYVQAKSALDREALKRGTSVYLTDRVIPMLPVELSNGICSLNQGEDRLALSCLIDIDEKGKVLKHQIVESVICVEQRMTYTDVKNILEDTDKEAKAKYADLVPLFHRMARLSQVLREKRKKRGAIDFDFPESKIVLNASGKPVEIKAYEQNVATRIIEDFMLLANETVAEEFCKRGYPFVYRVHENPDPEKTEALLTLLRSHGISVQKKRQEITPKEIQTVLHDLEGKQEEAQISRLILRTMKQARYTTDCMGHFGLAAKYYCHFTSPIRRYPDLQIHRIIKDHIRGRMSKEKIAAYREFLDDVAEQSSVMERRAEEAEREVEKLKKAEYMSYHIGEIYEGIISGVTGWGFYVELPNTVEGLVHVNSLQDDYYVYDKENHVLSGEMTRKRYGLGDTVTVRVADTDCVLKTIDFVLVKKEDEQREEEGWPRNPRTD